MWGLNLRFICLLDVGCSDPKFCYSIITLRVGIACGSKKAFSRPAEVFGTTVVRRDALPGASCLRKVFHNFLQQHY